MTSLQTTSRPGARPVLLCQAASVRCAFPLDVVAEVMRPLPVQPVAGVPPFVRGMTVVRGEAAPVVDAALLLGGAPSNSARFVSLRAGTRSVVVAVDMVTGVVDLPSTAGLPPLVAHSSGEAIAAIGVLDTEFLLVLRSAHLIPDDVWRSLNAAGAGNASSAEHQV